MSRFLSLVSAPFECWVEIWRWIGAQGGSDPTDAILRGIVHGGWAVVSLVLFPILLISILIGW